MSNKRNYGYFGEGAEGYAHYMQSFEENFSSNNNDFSNDSYTAYREKYHTDLTDDDDDLFLSDDEEDEDDWEDDEDEEDDWEDDEEELPTMTIDGTITLCPDESEFDFMMKFEEFLEENGWEFDGLTMDD